MAGLASSRVSLRSTETNVNSLPPARQEPPFSVVVINLDRDQERLAYMSRQLDRLQILFQRFPAFYGTQLPPALQPYFQDLEFLSKGEIGCYASHLAVYQAIADGAIAAPVLVLEDDVALPDDLAEAIAAILAQAPGDWDFVRLSGNAKRAFFAVSELGGERLLVRYAVSPSSNAGMLVSRSGATKFLKQVPRRMPIDQDNRCPWEFGLNLYGVMPAPIRGNTLPTSSIDDLSAGRSRENAARQRVLRKRRALWRRHGWNIQEFGLFGWAASEAVSLRALLTKRSSRAKLLMRMSFWLRDISKASA